MYTSIVLYYSTFSTQPVSKKGVDVPIVSIALSQLGDLRVGAHLCLHGPGPAVSCRHS